MKIIILNRKLEEGEEVTLLTDSTPDNWRGKNGDKIVDKVMECSIVNKKQYRQKVDC